ncbi:serine/threonine-protein kinase [Klugiella sp. YN-L-19]|uniref:non-specific serine/threonine protein kinase n=1 Tax=Ruicaihuangia caeni TaxID=3042517 RepID=A0AAW6T6N9_9MICO|nr:serine/threonine-protein kinase [Klugiella sp. YN-L-19]
MLPGFSYLHALGSGGFADVFLYEQGMPRRKVAVKVLLSEVVDENVRRMFQSEANLMAQLSSHPSILTVYQASVASDGRPYLVMELCSGALAERYRRAPLSVLEALRIAIRIGSAVETAHRAGVLHRDIKPSNILLTAYGHPVLADFGIAASLSELANDELVGISIPWSAPEVLAEETAGSIASEVWALGATVYSLLAGRSPFEIPGEQNGANELRARIARAKLPPLGRPDAPASLEAALKRSMSRRPEQRQRSVLELVRDFQAAERELGGEATPIDVAMDDWALASIAELDDRTLVRGNGGRAVAGGRRRRRSGSPSVATLVRHSSDTHAPGTGPSPEQRRNQLLTWLLATVAIVLIAVGTVATMSLIRAKPGEIPRVANIGAERSADSVRFNWADPGMTNADQYSVHLGDNPPVMQRTNEFIVDAQPGERVCLMVVVNRDGRNGEPSDQKCVELPE